jgi:hypothetical protein
MLKASYSSTNQIADVLQVMKHVQCSGDSCSPRFNDMGSMAGSLADSHIISKA